MILAEQVVQIDFEARADQVQGRRLSAAGEQEETLPLLLLLGCCLGDCCESPCLGACCYVG